MEVHISLIVLGIKPECVSSELIKGKTMKKEQVQLIQKKRKQGMKTEGKK